MGRNGFGALACALFLLAGVAAQAGEAASPAGTGSFVAFSDLHFNPLSRPALLGALEQAEPKDWEAILERPGAAGLGTYGEDAPWALVKSALDSMAAANPKPDFVLFLGDLVAHRFHERYFAYDARPTDARYTAFLGKTAAFIALELARRFPDTPILPVLGNNDSDCGDNSPQPGGAFMAAYAQAWTPLVGKGGGDFAATFPKGGYYDIPHPTVAGRRIVVIDDTFLSRKYRACGAGDGDVGSRQLDWLKSELHAAAAKGEKVWLLMHIPAGIDVYASLHKGACLLPPTPMLDAKYAQRFLDLVGEDRGAVQSLWSGHTHMDDSRILPGAEPLLDKIVPSVSPVFGNNPAFQVYTYDRGDGAIRDYRTWVLPGLGKAQHPAWVTEYDFAQVFGLAGVDGATLTKLVNKLPADADARRLYQTYFPSSDLARSAITPANWQAYWCGIGNVTPEAFQDCACGGGR